MMINFCHIVPTKYLPIVQQYDVHLLLAHLIEEDDTYRNFYINLKKKKPQVVYHLDNSAFEMFKRGHPMYNSEKLIQMGELVGATSIVMSDYPKEHWSKTVESAERLMSNLKSRKFKTFFCPQSELGDLEGLMRSFQWALETPSIDYIGISILSCPIALGVNETKYDDGSRDEAFRMQRYLSRYAIFKELNSRGLLSTRAYKRFHCLGMTEGPNEIDLLSPFHKHIYSWDSSSAVWHGINNIQYDGSPTGLTKGKLDLEVDFNHVPTITIDTMSKITYNMSVIDEMCRGE
jgi:hypothetical protein